MSTIQFMPADNFRDPRFPDHSDPLRVLLVENDEDMATLLRRDLSRRNCLVEWVTTLKEALAQASVLPYAEIIVLDLGLDDSTPEETIRQIEELQRYSPVLVLTGYTHDAIIESIERIGATFSQKGVPALNIMSIFSRANSKWAQGAAEREERFKRIDQKIAILAALFPHAPHK